MIWAHGMKTITVFYHANRNKSTPWWTVNDINHSIFIPFYSFIAVFTFRGCQRRFRYCHLFEWFVLLMYIMCWMKYKQHKNKTTQAERITVVRFVIPEKFLKKATVSTRMELGLTATASRQQVSVQLTRTSTTRSTHETQTHANSAKVITQALCCVLSSQAAD